MEDDRYTELANAIILQAAEDYRENKKKKATCKTQLRIIEKKLPVVLQKGDERKLQRSSRTYKTYEERLAKVEAEQKGIEQFFRSSWFKTLSEADGKMILDQLKRERRKRVSV